MALEDRDLFLACTACIMVPLLLLVVVVVVVVSLGSGSVITLTPGDLDDRAAIIPKGKERERAL